MRSKHEEHELQYDEERSRRFNVGCYVFVPPRGSTFQVVGLRVDSRHHGEGAVVKAMEMGGSANLLMGDEDVGVKAEQFMGCSLAGLRAYPLLRGPNHVLVKAGPDLVMRVVLTRLK